jgi:replicative DNA helicase
MAGDLSQIRIPSVPESEKAIACIALNNPAEFVMRSSEHRFNISDVYDPLCKSIIRVVYELECNRKQIDVRLVFESCKKDIPVIEFYQVSELWTLGTPLSVLEEHINLIRMTAKRRALISLLIDTGAKVSDLRNETAFLLADLNSSVDKLASETVAVKAPSLRKLLLEATERYATGDDSGQRIRTGFRRFDNLTPVKYSDFMVIGGETKAGKTTFALNIIANIITNTNQDEISKSDSSYYLPPEWDND